MIREVRFYDEVDDALLKFAVIAARSEGKWVFCRHREETGAEAFSLRPVCVYSVVRDDGESFGGLYYAEVSSFGELHSEIEKIFLLEEPLEGNWTYPEIQPKLLEEVRRRGTV